MYKLDKQYILVMKLVEDLSDFLCAKTGTMTEDRHEEDLKERETCTCGGRPQASSREPGILSAIGSKDSCRLSRIFTIQTEAEAFSKGYTAYMRFVCSNCDVAVWILLPLNNVTEDCSYNPRVRKAVYS